MNRILHMIASAVFSLALLIPVVANANDFVENVKKDTKALTDVPSRVLGTPGHEAAKEFIVKRVQSLPNVTLVRQPFDVMMPVTEKAVMTVPEGEFKGEHAIHPVWPDSVRLNTTSAEGISGPIVYIGEGFYESMPAKSLMGAIAAFEMSAYHSERWMRAFNFGAKAVLLLGSDGDTALLHKLRAFYKPRFYIPDGPLADACRQGKIAEAKLFAKGQWEHQTAENLLAMLKGSDASMKPLVVVASYDAMSLVPTLGPGADNAVDAAFLLQILGHLSKFPPKRDVIVAFVDAHPMNLLGMRHLCALLAIHDKDLTRETYMTAFDERITEYTDVAKQVEELGEDPLKALPELKDTTKYKLLQRYVKDVLSPEILDVREEVLQLRLDEVKLETEEARKDASEKLEKRLVRKKELDSILSGIINRGVLPEGHLEECAEVWKKIRQRVFDQLAVLEEDSKIFDRYDEKRSEVLAALSKKPESDIQFPFILGIDLSDAGVNVGPVYKCDFLRQNYERQGKDFSQWLKRITKADGNPYAVVPEERLKSLGLRADGLKDLVKSILNAEAVSGPEVKNLFAEALPEVDPKVVDKIVNEIFDEKKANRPNIEDLAFNILLQQLPNLEEAQAQKLVNDILNAESMKGGIDEYSINLVALPAITSVSASFEMSGVTWAALEGLRERVDTPQDNFKHLDWSRLNPQILLTSLMMEMLINDSAFDPSPSKTRTGTYPRWRLPEGLIVSETVAETIARTPEPNMLVTHVNENHYTKMPPLTGFRRQEFAVSGADGRFRFEFAPAFALWSARNRKLEAYHLEEDGRITSSVAKISSMLTTQGASGYSFRSNPPMGPLRAEAFDCAEINGPTFRDPRYQTELLGGKVFDVTRGGVPKKFIWNTVGGPMFGLLPPDTRYQLVLSTGAGKNRMALLNIPEDLNESGKTLRDALQLGFDPNEPLPGLPELISARDFFLIDEWRLRRLEGAGVSCKAIREIHEESKIWLDKAQEAYEADDGAGYKRASAAALANEIRVYQAVQDQANDVTRGAIFLLLLLVPFAIALERLLFASPEIGKQITKGMIIFSIMFAVLASFHPGFKITSMPAVILIAFMILLLSISVIKMLLNKFRSDMEELRRGTLAEASGAQTGRGGVIVSAIWLGIANMRKRMVRTLLTGLTIVLVTFSLLCFTSSSTYQDKRTTTLEGVEKTHDGILLQHPASRELEKQTEESVANLLGKDTTVCGRFWLTNERPTWRLHVRNTNSGRLIALKAGVGFRPDESKFSGVDSVLKNWQEFAKGDGCYLSEVNAKRIDAKVGDSIVVGGVSLKVIDIFDSREFEQKVKKLDGQDILPIDFTVQTEDKQDVSSMESEMSTGEGATPRPDLVFVSADDVIILPVSVAEKLGATLRSIAIRSDNEKTSELAMRLVKTIVYPVYYGADNGSVRAIVSTPLIPKAPRNLLIPIAIAVLIIFNTMLNSIAERKKEIYIYSSLGLAPRHIGVLFLAEALTYGVMGSVFGYVIGQGVATVLTHFNLMGGITLNYSGTNVIMTMGLVLLVVVISAIVPAFMAAKVASPSGDLDWKVPQPQDGIIRGNLPFTVSKQAAPGLAAFLHEFMLAHADGAIGSFTSDNTRIEEGDGDSVVRLKSTIWPAPYDLGVRQEICIDFEQSESDICDLRITLTHGAGPERSWWRLNRVFLGVMRQQLLGWRNIAPERMLKYIRQSEEVKREGK